MREMEVPAMRQAMREVGKMMLAEIDNTGFSIAMVTEMEDESKIMEPHRFRADECATAKRLMESAKGQVDDRIKNGAAVVIVGTSVLLHEGERRGPEFGGLPGVVVFAINRKEHAADLYSRIGGRSDRIRSRSGKKLTAMLSRLSDYLFAELPWPMVH